MNQVVVAGDRKNPFIGVLKFCEKEFKRNNLGYTDSDYGFICLGQVAGTIRF